MQLVNCWLGTRETTTPLIFDSYDNCLVQAVGLKLVRLFEHDQTARLYAGGGGGADGVGARGNVSAVDVDAPDLARFPRFSDAGDRGCLLAPRDLLFIPEGVWHHVRSLSTSCSVNFWGFDARGGVGKSVPPRAKATRAPARLTQTHTRTHTHSLCSAEHYAGNPHMALAHALVARDLATKTRTRTV